LIYDPALHVKFDDKIKLAEMLKQADRDRLTKIVKLMKQNEGVVDNLGNEKLQLKIDQITKPVFDVIV
jgi:hypothetical protein